MMGLNLIHVSERRPKNLTETDANFYFQIG